MGPEEKLKLGVLGGIGVLLAVLLVGKKKCSCPANAPCPACPPCLGPPPVAGVQSTPLSGIMSAGLAPGVAERILGFRYRPGMGALTDATQYPQEGRSWDSGIRKGRGNVVNTNINRFGSSTASDRQSSGSPIL